MYQEIPQPQPSPELRPELPPEESRNVQNSTTHGQNNDFKENEAFVIVDAFFKKHGITSQQIQSFNDFVENGIPKILDDMPEIVIEDYAHRATHFFKITSEGHVFSPPTFVERDVVETKMYPNTARIRDITYSGELSIKVIHVVQREGKLKRVVEDDSKLLRKIGRIPVMVMSNCCRLSKLNSEKEFESLRECSLDPGGYFIIDGKERVVISQERAANNTPFVFRKYSHAKSVLECEIRSAIENTSASASAFWVRLHEQSLPIDKRMGLWKNLNLTSKVHVIKIMFPGLSKAVDLYIFYQAIGFNTPQAAYESIVDYCARQPEEQEKESLQRILPFLIPSFQQWKKMTVEEAKEVIGNLYTYIQRDGDNYDLDLDELENHTKEERRRFVETLLHRNFLPHIGMNSEPEMLRKKGFYLSYMVWKLLMVFVGQMPYDDRDHLQNKRFQCSGPLLGQLFHRSLHALKQEMEKSLRNQIRKCKLDLHMAISPNLMTNTIKHCLATGNWGSLRDMQSKNCRIYSNVTQQLNRYTRNSHLSSLRRLNSPVDKLHLMTKPRQLHNTYFGVICPSETPEGVPIGLVKHMALLAQVTVSFPIEKVVAFLHRQKGVIDLESGIRTQLYRKGLTKIFVDGTWIGFTSMPAKLVKRFKEERRSSTLSPYVSIFWSEIDGAIEIRADAGRLCRPLLVAKKNHLRLKRPHLAGLREGKLSWDDLIAEGVVEIIDVAESESTLIAMDLEKLKSPTISTWTHMEIHPALMFGVCASTIPFSNHTQSPRIVYQSGIAKQAMGIYGSNLFSRMDVSNHFLHYGHRPIVQSKCMKYSNYDQIPAGSVCTVAICCYSGYNMEDSVILNRSAVERGLFRSTLFQTVEANAEAKWLNNDKEKSEELFVYPSRSVTKQVRLSHAVGRDESTMMQLYENIGPDGLPSPGDRVGDEPTPKTKLKNYLKGKGTQAYDETEQHAIIGKVTVLTQSEIDADSKQLSGRDAQGKNMVKSNILYKDASIFDRKPTLSHIDSAMVTDNAVGERLVKVRIRKHLQPQVGDKFASLHGQKGVVGLDYHEVDMPFTKQGISPDLIMNPHGLPSRMTVGQLHESFFGKAGALEGRIMDGTPFHKRNLEEVCGILEKHGFRQDGTEVMYDGRTGRKIRSPIFIGPTYYQRLKHMVDDKIHSRGRGMMDVLTQQPVKGFARSGGLRFGEMERDCLITHGCAVLLMERLMDVSDAKKIPICGDCGLIASNRPLFDNIKGYNVCISCEKTRPDSITASQIYTIRMPYAAKLFFQELMCMNITPRIMPSDIKNADGDTDTALYTTHYVALADRKISDIPAPAARSNEDIEMETETKASDPPPPPEAEPVKTMHGIEDITSYDPRPFNETGGEE